MQRVDWFFFESRQIAGLRTRPLAEGHRRVPSFARGVLGAERAFAMIRLRSAKRIGPSLLWAHGYEHYKTSLPSGRGSNERSLTNLAANPYGEPIVVFGRASPRPRHS